MDEQNIAPPENPDPNPNPKTAPPPPYPSPNPGPEITPSSQPPILPKKPIFGLFTKIVVIIFLCLAILTLLLTAYLYIFSTSGKTQITYGFNKTQYYTSPNGVYFHNGHYLIGDNCSDMLCFEFFPIVEKVKGADKNTFDKVKGTLDVFQDKDHIIYQGKLIDSSDRQTFELIKDPIPDCRMHLAKDKNGVYSYSYPNGMTTLPEADPNTFKVLSCVYGTDKNHVYHFSNNNFEPSLFKVADVATFSAMEGSYAKDKNHVYWSGRIIDGADPATAKMLSGIDKIADSKNIYNGVACWNHEEDCVKPLDAETKNILDAQAEAEAISQVIRNEIAGIFDDDYMHISYDPETFFPKKSDLPPTGDIIRSYDVLHVGRSRMEDYIFKSFFITFYKNTSGMNNEEFLKNITPNPDDPNVFRDQIELKKIGNAEYVKSRMDKGKSMFYERSTPNYQLRIQCNAPDRLFNDNDIAKIESFITGITFKQ